MCSDFYFLKLSLFVRNIIDLVKDLFFIFSLKCIAILLTLKVFFNPLSMDQSRYHPRNKLLEFFEEEGSYTTVRPSECLLNIGEKCDKVFLILSGGFVCQNYNPMVDRLRTINFHLELFHPIMTVIQSFFSDSISNCQLKAVMRSDVLVLQKGVILNALKEDDSLHKAYVEETIYALLAINEFHTKLITLTTKDMYHYLEKECPEIVRQIPAKYIAEFMGVTPEWLSRIR